MLNAVVFWGHLSWNTMAEEIRTAFQRGWNHLGEVSNCHGVVDFHNSRSKPQKFLWAIALLSAFIAIFYNFALITSQYIEEPTATKIDDVSVTRLKFPNVTVCTRSKLSLKNIMTRWSLVAPHLRRKLGNVSDPTSFAGWILALAGSTDLEFNPSEFDLLERQFQLSFNQTLNESLKWDVQEFLKQTAVQCSELFNYCQFSSKLFDCCKNVNPVLSLYGVCYHITPKPRLSTDIEPYQSLSGNLAGLRLSLAYNNTDAPNFANSNTYPKGFFITIAPYYALLETDSVSIPAGTHANVLLRPTYRILQQKKSQCATDSPDGHANGIHSYRLCQQQCFSNLTRELYGCEIISSYWAKSSSALCSPLTALMSMNKIVISGDPVIDGKFLTCTNVNCTKMCEFWSYFPSVSYSEMVPTTKFLNDTANKGIELAIVDVYFPQLSYTQVALRQIQILKEW